MSAEAFVQALHHSQATGTIKVIMLAIANYAGEQGAWCSVSTLAKIANVTPDNARKALRKLEELGEITTDTNGGYQMNKPKHTRTNRYEIELACPEWCDRSMQHRDTRGHNSGPSETTDPRKRRTLGNDAPGPSETTDEPNINQTITKDVNSSKTVITREPEKDSSSIPEVQPEPRRHGAIARAQKIANEAKRRTRYLPPPAPAPVSEAKQAANRIVLTLRCPSGFGEGASSRHLVLVTTGDGCARCGDDSFDILDAHNRLETT